MTPLKFKCDSLIHQWNCIGDALSISDPKDSVVFEESHGHSVQNSKENAVAGERYGFSD